MKTIKLFSILFLFATLMTSCGANDDDSNDQTCTQEGFGYVNGNNIGAIMEADLTTVHDPSASTPLTEIFGFTNSGSVIFIVDYLSNTNAQINIDNNGLEAVTVNLIINGTNVGDLLRYTISGTYQGQPIEAEFCVIVDQVL